MMTQTNLKICKKCEHIVVPGHRRGDYGCMIVWAKTSYLNDMIRGEFNGPFYMIKYSKHHEQEMFKDLPQTYHKKGFNERFVIPTECPYILEHTLK